MTTTEILLGVLTATHGGSGVAVWRARGWVDSIRVAVKTVEQVAIAVEDLHKAQVQMHESNQARLSALENRRP